MKRNQHPAKERSEKGATGPFESPISAENLKQDRRHPNPRNAAIKATPQADGSHPGEIDADLEDLLIDADDFDADALALVTDVQRMHFDQEGLVG
jgi:hypothetical protein